MSGQSSRPDGVLPPPGWQCSTTVSRSASSSHIRPRWCLYGVGTGWGRKTKARASESARGWRITPVVCSRRATAGPLLVRAGVNAENVDRALESIDIEVAGLARDGATGQEVMSAKRYPCGAMPRSLETNAGIARFLQTAQQFDLGLDHDSRLPALVDAVTVEAVAEAARRTLMPEQATVVIAGPYEGS